MSHPRAEALDAMDHLACKFAAVAALMTTEETCFSPDEVFGLHLIFSQAAAELKKVKARLENLIPAK